MEMHGQLLEPRSDAPELLEPADALFGYAAAAVGPAVEPHRRVVSRQLIFFVVGRSASRSHLCLAAVVDRGPRPDDLEFRPLLKAACRRHRFRALLADCGYDAEHHHRFLNDTLGVIGIIPPTRGRPAKNPEHLPRGLHRRFLHQHWPGIKPLYGQRWQSESYFSMSKRLLDSFLRSRKRANQDRELHLRNINMNLMLAADP